MKKRNVILCTLLAAAVLSACGEEPDSGRGRRPETGTEAPEGSGTKEEPETTGAPEEDPTPTPEANDPWVHVDNMEDFVEAIGPGARIRLETGSYSLSDYLEDAWNAEGEAWNNRHEYVQIRDVYDGLELVIWDADGLIIEGGDQDPGKTELLTDPRYASVLNYEHCEQVVVSNITIGHTDTGSCLGDVLHFYACKDVSVVNADLFGCGVYGINMDECEGRLKCNECVIHDCSFGPLYNIDSTGEWIFTDCKLINSEEGGYFSESRGLSLKFVNCEFGDQETDYFMYRSDTTTENCTWGDPNSNSYFGGMEYGLPEEFHPEDLTEVDIDPDFFDGTTWYGFAVTDEDTGATTEVENTLYFDENGTGYLDELYTFDLLEWQVDSAGGARIIIEDSGEEYPVYLYWGDGDSYYLKLVQDGQENWFY
ncbi:MAG: hypothetical protein J6N53_09775 [Lachnospiraceae bacterium]|nr:hypothetical protein [Lachnospiraceae bacterium]